LQKTPLLSGGIDLGNKTIPKKREGSSCLSYQKILKRKGPGHRCFPIPSQYPGSEGSAASLYYTEADIPGWGMILLMSDPAAPRSKVFPDSLTTRERIFSRGFRMLTLGMSDGATFLPLSFSLSGIPPVVVDPGIPGVDLPNLITWCQAPDNSFKTKRLEASSTHLFQNKE
ncbi:MAG: hypothetical protein WCP87_06840, partial [Atribacterota bacterium]